MGLTENQKNLFSALEHKTATEIYNMQDLITLSVANGVTQVNSYLM